MPSRASSLEEIADRSLHPDAEPVQSPHVTRPPVLPVYGRIGREHPEQWQAPRFDSALLDAAIEETLRV
jgi:hypothetical protein